MSGLNGCGQQDSGKTDEGQAGRPLRLSVADVHRLLAI
jgi:hypothetical protein